MWLIDKCPFLNPSVVQEAINDLRSAQSENKLTLIVGNGVSSSAIWHQSLGESIKGRNKLSWSDVIKKAAIDAGFEKKEVESCRNNLALAQAILVKAENNKKNIKCARANLVKELFSAFRGNIKLTEIDKCIVNLRPSNVITTNYDYQLERAFEKYGKSDSDWHVVVRQGVPNDKIDLTSKTVIHKIHGTFSPAENMAMKYTFKSDNERDALESIVISETDYDDCYHEMDKMKPDSLLGVALSNTCLIIGKSLDLQDLSYIYVLRKTRKFKRKIYMLFNGELTYEEKINVSNLNITPLIINVPRASSRNSGHYYFGVLSAMSKLFPKNIELYEDAKKSTAEIYFKLIGAPNVLSIGLVSRNITGITKFQGKQLIPPAGRRSMAYDCVEEHIGGSALTPMMILESLNRKNNLNLSLSSSIGMKSDSYSNELLKISNSKSINTDAVSMNQEACWHSTVLVHSYEAKDGTKYPGQRIFLDRGYNKAVELEPEELNQLEKQLEQDSLQILYLDKFLATQHPPPTNENDMTPDNNGPILKNIKWLENLVKNNNRVDIVYETGGTGSREQHVENILNKYINVFTAGFPFFAHVVMQNINGYNLPDSLKGFGEDKWWEFEFSDEHVAINDLLVNIFNLENFSPRKNNRRLWEVNIDQQLLEMIGNWCGRESELKRKWFIVTLHHYGALGFDIVNEKGWYCSAPYMNKGEEIKNTSGAGDSFRGALMHALLNSMKNETDDLPKALLFSTDVASERCKYFSIELACQKINEKFADKFKKYGDTEIINSKK